MEFTAIPLALLAGVLSLLSPCVLPMVPAVAASAIQSSRLGLLMLAAGISLSFALAGTILTFLLLNAGISPDVMRYFSAGLLLLMGIVLLVPALSDQMAFWLSRFTSRLPGQNISGNGVAMQFVIGASLGLIWLPCVGPTLGTAIALASTGQSMPMAFIVMLTFGLGAALPLVFVGHLSGAQLAKLRLSGQFSKYLLGAALLLIALMIFTGFDKVLEIWAIEWLPDWVTSI
ncbi:cytochrome c biogenesis CcdA family protein [Arsukibacterium perlucidum]|uniref:cytochrome c biogenesis CcdA family protein n=1 Tax=Arsukibacterium perlucidum TaxID=368811 RepID=UPI0003606969|nr:cytochrome c biogenesis protein CcdA [Arsukibacterium perlucidum]